MKIKDLKTEKNYIHIDNWMINRLSLSSKNELLVYAVVYSYSEKDGQGYYGSLETLAKRVKTSKSRVCKVLSSLVKKGYLNKKEEFDGSNKYCFYTVNYNIELLPDVIDE